MKNSSLTLAVAALAVSLQLASSAELTGKVTLKGAPPPERDIAMDATCGKFHEGPVKTRLYLTGQGAGLANVFVYVKAGAKPAATPPAETPLIDQVGCIYEPYVNGIMVNQKFKVRNSDAVLHNVHATPKVNKEFNFAQPVKGQVNEKSFSEAEVMVRIKCDVHPWMFTYVGVVDNPYYAVTDKDGNFKISNLPPGKYTLEAFHLKAGASAQEIAVDGDKKVDFTLEVPPAP
ncbi:MAG: hypothetical protein H7X97_10700 [Opitutaceae bacterium]|nr:hypothetical protein [Verrucomicrobiales bacterium]